MALAWHSHRAVTVFRSCPVAYRADFSEHDRVHLGEELSDVYLYLTRLAGTARGVERTPGAKVEGLFPGRVPRLHSR